MVMEQLPITLQHCPVLVIGWGRIGKCLAKLLKAMGASVSVAARKEQDRAMLLALEYDALDTMTLGNSLARFRVILNTAPELVLTKEDTAQCAANCLKIELASLPGIDAPDVIRANGLPNKNAPQTSGELIARTILRLLY
jgi:dipicolinate synthase subunit A